MIYLNVILIIFYDFSIKINIGREMIKYLQFKKYYDKNNIGSPLTIK